MLRQFSTKRIVSFFLVDWLGTLGMLALAGFIRAMIDDLPPLLIALLQATRIPIGGLESLSGEAHTPTFELFALITIIWPFFFITFSVYDGRRNETVKAELYNVFLAICVSTVTLAGVLYLTYRDTSRVLFAIFFMLDALFLITSRLAFITLRHFQNKHKQPVQQSVLIIGAGPVGQDVVRQLKKYAWANANVIGYVDDDPAKLRQSFVNAPVIGTLDQISDITQTCHIHIAIAALPLQAHKRLVETCQILQKLGVRVYVIPDLFALSFPSALLEGFGGIPVIDLGQPGLYGRQRLVKRAFDIIAVLLGSVLILPLLVLIAIAIKLDSPGPVLYKQERIGENGRPFTMFKFRSMYSNADHTLHKQHITRLIEQNLDVEQLNGDGQHSLKLSKDPRITRVGALIRKASLDELPQLFNVLRGEMSLVGPRPPIAYEVELYQDWHKKRLEAIPGMTGLWQVKGRNRVSFDEMVRLDIEYIEHQSLWQDIKILLQTPLAIALGQGAG